MTTIQGVWLPVITPFADGAVDFVSYERLLEHYLARGVRGIFPLGTTGEGPTLAHVATERFVAIHERMTANDHHAARSIWARLEPVVPLLFKEATPMPIKHCLWRAGVIASPECRLPLTRVSSALTDVLDRALKDAIG